MKIDIKFYVEDTGIGIPDDKHDQIFELFRQIEDANTRVYGGTGIGLTISHKLVEILGGKLWFASEVGKGSIFYFTIPFTGDPKSLIPKDDGQKVVLIVEDDESSFEFLKFMLTNKNYRVIWASRGLEAIKICQERSIDLVLMDINMPGMNGYEATAVIKEKFPDLPIIAQTAYAVLGDKEKAIDAGCDDYIPKPIKRKELNKLLKKYLGEMTKKPTS